MVNKLSQIAVIFFGLILLWACQNDGTPHTGTKNHVQNLSRPKEAVEVYESREFQNGYTLIAPLTSKNTYLIDMEGYVVNRWTSDYTPNNSVYLLEDGTLVRTEKIGANASFSGNRVHGGRMARYSYDGKLLWAWNYSSDEYSQHHDVEVLPNGNILVIAWETKPEEEVIEIGKDPQHVNSLGVWPEHIVEVESTGDSGGQIVWEWHQWDHLIQDFDPNKSNFGDVAAHPELIDINFSQSTEMDISHFNAIDYIIEHDLIILSAHHFNEFWIIDHSTTTTEAASHQGGKRGKGGDLLYRWGNPLAHKNGLTSDQIAFSQHDPVWLGDLPSNGGNLIFFNNGDGKKNREFSTVDEILLPIDENGNFELLSTVLNQPTSIAWRFEQDDFYSASISGVQRLKNGNTLICEGRKGLLHEVTVDKRTVWKYNLPLQQKAIFRAHRYPVDYSAFSGKSLERLEIEIE